VRVPFDYLRYLVAKDPSRPLSAASRTTLVHQGGPMAPAEVAAADADPRWPAALRLRAYDEVTVFYFFFSFFFFFFFYFYFYFFFFFFPILSLN